MQGWFRAVFGLHDWFVSIDSSSSGKSTRNPNSADGDVSTSSTSTAGWFSLPCMTNHIDIGACITGKGSGSVAAETRAGEPHGCAAEAYS